MIEEMLAYNKAFVAGKQYERYRTSKYPDKKIAVLSCMDTRLTELLPAALGVRNGDIKLLKNAGGTISAPFGSMMRSLFIAVYELGVQEIMVVGHYDCGVQHMDGDKMLQHMRERGIQQESIDFLDYCGFQIKDWLTGFDNVENAVYETVHLIQAHPLIPKDVRIAGFLMDPETGRIDPMALRNKK